MAGKPWSDEDVWAIVRAYKLYERQPRLIHRFEQGGWISNRTVDSVQRKIARLKKGWKPPPGTKKIKLRIEEEPEDFAQELYEYIGGRKSTGHVPQVLEKYIDRRPKAERIETVHAVDTDSVEYTESKDWAKARLKHGVKITTLEELLEYLKIDLKVWRVSEHRVKAYQGQVKGPDGKPIITQMFSIYAKFVPLKRERQLKLLKSSTLEAMKNHAPVYEIVKKRKSGGLLWECGTCELHLGKITWVEEVGEEYNLDVASELYQEITKDQIAEVGGISLDKIFYIVGNDFLHVDSKAGETTKGTRQDTDRWPRIMDRARDLTVWAIDQLRQIAPVEVIAIAGNHDENSVFALGQILSAWYRQDKQVTVDASPRLRKYKRWGITQIGFTHGKHEKFNQLPLLMAREASEDWGQTEIHEMHVGHMHKKMVTEFLDEFNGVIVRRLTSLSAPDYWHFKMGHVKSLRSAEGLIWDKERGLKQIFYSHVN